MMKSMSRNSFRTFSGGKAQSARTAGSLLLVACAVAFLGAPTGVQAQELETRGFQVTRDQLEATLVRLEEATASGGYSRSLRQQAEREAELVRSRLETGDFRVGDRIDLRVRGHDGLSGTYVIESGQVIQLPQIGEVNLRGILRSELRDHLTQELSRYIRNPEITTESLIRLGIMGHVNSPGFMVLPASMLLEDALMAAGGPGRDADLDRIRVDRGGNAVWEGAPLQDALVHGLTLDQLSLRAGDRIEVPRRSTSGLFTWGTLRILLVTVPSVIWSFHRIGWL
jgi:protein involved in polysaccharide export with SLBB domain